MAVTIVDNRSILNEADANTGWSGSPTVYTSDPYPAEATGSLGLVVSTSTVEAYNTQTSDDWTNGSFSIIVQDNGAMDSLVNGGIMAVVGDGTNRIGYHVGGSDKGGLRHNDGPVKWHQFILDLGNKPTNFTTFAGSEASLDESAITQYGVAFKTLSKALGNTQNCFFDILRWADPGVGIEVYGGTSGTPETFSTIATNDRATTNQAAHFVVKEVTDGVYAINGNINLGDKTSTNDTYIDIENETLAWLDRSLSATNYYRFTVAGNATGSTVINITNSSLVVPSSASASIDTSDANVTDCNVTGCQIIGFDQGVITGGSGQDWQNNSFIGCGQITTNGADLRGSNISGYEGTAGTGAMLYNIVADPDGELDNMNFTKGTASTHAIQFGTSAPTTMTLRDITFSGYNASDQQTDSTLYFPDTGSDITWTVNLIGVTGNVSYYKARSGDTVNITQSVTLTITVKDSETKSVIQNAQVSMHYQSVTGGKYDTQAMNEDTDVNGIATEAYTGSTPKDMLLRIRKSEDTDNPRYQAFSDIVTVAATTGYTRTVFLERSTILN